MASNASATQFPNVTCEGSGTGLVSISRPPAHCDCESAGGGERTRCRRPMWAPGCDTVNVVPTLGRREYDTQTTSSPNDDSPTTTAGMHPPALRV